MPSFADSFILLWPVLRILEIDLNTMEGIGILFWVEAEICFQCLKQKFIKARVKMP